MSASFSKTSGRSPFRSSRLGPTQQLPFRNMTGKNNTTRETSLQKMSIRESLPHWRVLYATKTMYIPFPAHKFAGLLEYIPPHNDRGCECVHRDMSLLLEKSSNTIYSKVIVKTILVFNMDV